MRTRDQRRAEGAYSRVAKRKGSKTEAEYKRFVKRFPALTMNAGLAQAVAFAESKASEESNDLPGILDDIAALIDPGLAGVAYAQEVRTAGIERYQWLTRETLAATGWLKRYAEALLRDPDSDQEDDDAPGVS